MSVDEINSSWWDIMEWAEYYKEIFNEYPKETLRNYGTTGFIGDFEFPNGDKITINTNSTNYPMTRNFKSISNMNGSMGPTLIFDTYLADNNPYFGTIRVTQDRRLGSWNPF
jgi:hypothetical protein